MKAIRMDASDLLIVLITAPEDKSESIAKAIVESSCAACVNILPACQSIYRWQGAIAQATENILIVKTSQARLEELRTLVAQLHPYDVPEFIALSPATVDAAYGAWWSSEVTRTPAR